ncbi:MAG: hypothetical protein C0582_01485 [Alphaproteobacteria bacterium]|nr:MAG: hypothetical protein C0582_01485 [Alphaproteobacteria bacterium]
MSVEGGGTFTFNQLPSPDGQTSSQPALTIETFTNSKTGEIRVRVPLERALPGLQEILAKNTGEVEIVPIQNTHHADYFEVVSLSPTLSVAIAIAVAVLTKGMGSSLLGATGEAATFFADAGFTAISKNLAHGFAGEFVGDHQALERAFNADAVKQMAVNIVGQYMGQQVAGDLGIDPNGRT